jgi:hypothetical protein
MTLAILLTNIIISLSEEESKVRFEKDLATLHNLADAAYLSKARHKEDAVKEESNVAWTLVPSYSYSGNVNCSYKRVLWPYNLTIRDSKSGRAYATCGARKRSAE